MWLFSYWCWPPCCLSFATRSGCSIVSDKIRGELGSDLICLRQFWCLRSSSHYMNWTFIIYLLSFMYETWATQLFTCNIINICVRGNRSSDLATIEEGATQAVFNVLREILHVMIFFYLLLYTSLFLQHFLYCLELPVF